jgi:hypothetical protein
MLLATTSKRVLAACIPDVAIERTEDIIKR